MKKIIGYVRSIPGGVGISGVPVSIRLQKDNTLVPVGGMAQASVNPINTDSDGRFEWECELSPGPVKVEAAIDSGSELKVRVGEEVMQAGDMFISDIATMGQMFSNGVIDDVDDELVVAPVTGALQVTVAAGAINFYGRIFQTHTTRTLNIDPNTTLTNRIDAVYAEHVRTGVDAGKQTIGIVKGTVNGVVPALGTPAGAVRLSLARITIPQGATSVTVSNVAALSSPTNVNLDAGSVKLTHLATEVTNKLTDNMFTITSPSTGQHLAYSAGKWVNESNLLSAAEDATITSPAAGQVLTYSGGKWKNIALPAFSIAGATDTALSGLAANQVLTYVSPGVWKNKALPAPPTVSIAAAADSVISSPANGQFLVYSSSRWRNATLSIDIPSSKYAEVNIGHAGAISGMNRLLGSCSVTVPAGTWVLKGAAYGQAYSPSSAGGLKTWFQGSAVTGTNAFVHFTTTNWRQWVHEVGRVVSPSSTTTYTLDLWCAHEGGGGPTLGASKLILTAY